ncbi:antibiotic biosynthesis monooxygenase [Candidatus Woesearchaeota archaeon]|nr:antibiotic biosynthesis monooxygenase [Candidatus Woesearchaeota archaeon]
MVKYKIKKEEINEAKKAIREFINSVLKNEPGTHYYGAYQLNDNVSFVHFMEFRDEKSKKIHENTSYVKKFVSILYPNCVEKPVFTELKLIKSNMH